MSFNYNMNTGHKRTFAQVASQLPTGIFMTEASHDAKGPVRDPKHSHIHVKEEYVPLSLRPSDHISNRKVWNKRENARRVQRLKDSRSNRCTPQSGDETTVPDLGRVVAQVHQTANKLGVKMPEKVMREAEALIALVVAMSECSSLPQFSSILFLYIRDHFDASMTSVICGYISDIFNKPSPQSDEPLPQWIESLKSVQGAWQMFRSNHSWKHMQEVLCILVSIGLCRASDLEFSIAGYQLVDKEMLEKQREGSDLIDAIVNVIVFFSQGAYLCFKKGSLRPLLMSDSGACEVDEEYVLILKMWDLVHSGNLQKIMHKTDAEFITRLEALSAKLNTMKESLRGFDRRLIMSKIERLALIANDFVTLKISCGVREAPFAIELFGDSAQGKTNLGDTIVSALLAEMDYPQGPEYRAIINPDEKYQSTWYTNKLVAVFDDVANTKAQFTEGSPLKLLIDFCNNQTAVATKADIQDKGKCFIEPKIVLATTNKKTLDAGTYSNCPYSIQRRMDVVITVRAKTEFQRLDSIGTPCGIDPQKVIESQMVDGVHVKPPIDDIWELTLEKAVKPANLTHVASYEVIVHNGKKLENVSARDAIAYLMETFRKHVKSQETVVAHMRNNNDRFARCQCGNLDAFCSCSPTPHIGWILGEAAHVATKAAGSALMNMTYHAEVAGAEKLYDAATSLDGEFSWVKMVPGDWYRSRWLQGILIHHIEDRTENYIKWFIRFWRFTCLLWCVCMPSAAPIVSLLYFAVSRNCDDVVTAYYLRKLEKKRGSIPRMVRRIRDDYASLFLKTIGVAAGIMLLVKVIQSFWWFVKQDGKKVQGSLDPQTIEEVHERDAEVDQWAQFALEPVQESVLRTNVPSDVRKVVERNLRYGRVHLPDGGLMLNTLFLTSNVCFVPDHYFEQVGDTIDISFLTDNTGIAGRSFRTKLSLSTSVKLHGDMRLCYVPSGGSFRDLRKHFPEEHYEDTGFEMIWRNKDGNFLDWRGRGRRCLTSNGRHTFKGLDYKNLTRPTFDGMCGATLISHSVNAGIAGFHVGGITGKPVGSAVSYSQSELAEAMEALRDLDTVLITGEDAGFRSVQLGKEVFDGVREPSKKSPLRYMPEGASVAYRGGCVGAATYRSDVRKTFISDTLTEVTGVENIWGKPKFQPEWYGWQKCLSTLSTPAQPFDPTLLQRASECYKRALIDVIEERPFWRRGPLNEKETLLGIPGEKFMDAIKLNTSIGFPMGGSKRKHVLELPPDDVYECNREFTPEIMAEIHEVEEKFRKGERAFCIAKACKKDEILPVAKEKCRIFYGNTIALTYLVRKYYLPVLRFLQMNSLVSECAVGVNSHGPEWEVLYQHMIAHGKDRIFAGDYSKYDQRMPSQLTAAALRICIDIARAMGYSEEDLRIMEVMAGEIVFPYIAFNGDLISLSEGTHISGNSLTVIINSIVGSLNLRCFYYHVYPSDPTGSFRRFVNIITYGDDNKGSVSAARPKFNIKACSEFLAQYGQIYTMPDKESELVPYMHDDDAEFLKRKSVYHDNLECHVGALDENSIFKSLHCYMRPKGCPLTCEEAVAQNIDGALREWFNHGPDVYAARREQMSMIAQEHKIDHLCLNLGQTYEQMCIDWHTKYSTAEESAD